MLGLKLSGEIVCPRNSALVLSTSALARDSLRLCFSKSFKKGSGVCGVGSGIRIVHECAFKVSGDALKAFGHLVDYFDEPVGDSTAALRHHYPLEKVGQVCRKW